MCLSQTDYDHEMGGCIVICAIRRLGNDWELDGS